MSTSRIGRKPVIIPSGVEVKIQGQKFLAKGSKGQLSVDIHPFVQVKVDNNTVNVHLSNESDHIITGKSVKLYRSIAGTTRANINNLIQGVSVGFERRLTLVGVGYRAQAKGKVVALNLGFSHLTEYEIPEGITVETPTPTEIIIKGVDKIRVGAVASELRGRYRKPEPYKGKGVRYANEVIELKETKKK